MINEVHPVKMEIELYPQAIELLEGITRKTGVSKSEIIEKMLLKYIPLNEERALELIIDDITTRTERLTKKQKKIVYVNILKFIADDCAENMEN